MTKPRIKRTGEFRETTVEYGARMRKLAELARRATAALLGRCT